MTLASATGPDAVAEVTAPRCFTDLLSDEPHHPVGSGPLGRAGGITDGNEPPVGAWTGSTNDTRTIYCDFGLGDRGIPERQRLSPDAFRAVAEARVERLQAQWCRLVVRVEAEQQRHVAERVRGWQTSMIAMAAESAQLKANGRWARGPRTLLEVLGLQAREVTLVAGLRWLLDPQGSHRLGDLVLAGLLSRLNVHHPADTRSSARVEVSRPDERGRARADLVLHIGPVTVLIEAKVHADDHPEQCDRLARLWAAERPTLVFLTLDGRAPKRSPRTAEQWLPVTWAAVARIVERAVAEREPSPGVLDLLHTLNNLYRNHPIRPRSSSSG